MKKLSQFTHILQKDGCPHIALFHAGRIATAFVDREAYNFLQKLQDGINEDAISQQERCLVDQLEKQGFLSNPVAEKRALEIIRSTLKPRLTLMYLILTDFCNLGCKYCFIEAGFPKDYKCNNMSWETAKLAMDYFIEHRDRTTECSVWLYGGEPFLNAKLFFQCMDYLSEKDPEICKVTVSNGTVINDEIAERLSSYDNLQISISLDGPQDINDQKRVFKSGRGSFQKTMAGINNLKKHNVNFGISCTIAEHNVKDIDKILTWICEETGSKDLGVNFLVDTPKAFVDEEYIKQANEGMIRFIEQARSTNIYEGRMARKIEAFVQQKPRWHDCGACGAQIVISPTGEVGICHEGLGERRTFVGELNDSFDFFNQPTVTEWAKRSPVNMPECKGCIAFGVCGGGCPYGAMLRYGDIWDVDKRFCVHSKDTLVWLIWDLYNKMTTKMK